MEPREAEAYTYPGSNGYVYVGDWDLSWYLGFMPFILMDS